MSKLAVQLVDCEISKCELDDGKLSYWVMLLSQ